MSVPRGTTFKLLDELYALCQKHGVKEIEVKMDYRENCFLDETDRDQKWNSVNIKIYLCEEM